MSYFDTVYKILKTINAAMDYEDSPADALTAEWLGITEPFRVYIFRELVGGGYVKGIELKQYGFALDRITIKDPYLTIKGMEYLETNPMMEKARNRARGIET